MEVKNGWGRYYLSGGDFRENAEMLNHFRQAYRLGLLEKGEKVFLNKWSSVYAILGEVLYIRRRWDNGNGSHDVAVLSIPDLQEIGRMFYHDYPNGIHRDTIVI